MTATALSRRLGGQPTPAVPLLWRLARLVAERFPPRTYGPLILAFVVCGYVGAAGAAGAAVRVDERMALASGVVALAFLRLRLVDEIKDAEVDRQGRPDRPVPRGLVTVPELAYTAVACAAAELAGALLLGPPAFLAYGIFLGYSVAAAKDFFCGAYVHRSLVTYALAHSPFTPLLLAFVWFAHPEAGLGVALASLLLLVWGVALALEVARKIVPPSEERPYVETYSAALGEPRAARLCLGFLAAAALGAAAYAAVVGAAVPLIVAALSLAGAAFAPAFSVVSLPRLVRPMAGASAVCIVLLLWPAILALVEGGSR